ncbi:pyridoxamine 5'-phosphate oxidase family protein [Tropicibacter sp. R15_0]|uniref:pyridoxamine 5'-phosphate oxidase family protein n=1 Tax=Tropicibacter sp. R15_0 TaxID=2821101 RepID=UPI001ADC8582|nr:pyridoxamine 5'-phosphate oxidase family protein [Tropicibacter sp. R15_0]MBO9468030.1 pyridoxamine 5'-phosphate oxidase family protein [Tropicibacter sp. R15_0]
MLNRFAKELIEDWRLGLVASTNADGTPNLSPKGTFVVHDDTTLGFADLRSPGTVENIAERPVVEVNFVDQLTRRGVRLRGQARIVSPDMPEFAKLKKPYIAGWPDLADMINAIVLIDLSEVKPICTPAYDAGAECDTLRQSWMERIRDINIKHSVSEAGEC